MKRRDAITTAAMRLRTPGAEGAQSIKVEVVKLKDRDKMLPAGIKRVTPAERKTQLAERTRSFNLRFAEN